MNVKIPAFAILVEAIMYLLFHNLHDCTFKGTEDFFKNLDAKGVNAKLLLEIAKLKIYFALTRTGSQDNSFHAWSVSIPSQNIRKLEVF